MVLPGAPSVAPGRVAPPPADPLAQARDRYLEGDLAGVVTVLGPWLDSKKGPKGRARAAAWLLYGTSQMGLRNWNLASFGYTQAKKVGGPIAPYAAWYEAVMDLQRGRASSAAGVCAAYRKAWPTGAHFDECLMLMGDAYAAAGNPGAAAGAYRAYLEKYPETPRKEEVRLGIALGTARRDPAAGLPLLVDLMLDHNYPSTELAVQQALDELGRRGLSVVLPTDKNAKMRRCNSLRRSGKLEEAWALFEELRALAKSDPEVARWVEENEERLARGTRNFDVLAATLTADYAKKPDADTAWGIYRAWAYEGEQGKAWEWATIGLEKHAGQGRWRSAEKELAWTAILAGQHAAARDRWGRIAKRGGDLGRHGRLLEGLAAYQSGDYAGAIAAWELLLKSAGGQAPAAYYWRAKARAASGDLAGAAADQAACRSADEWGWYTLLLDQDPTLDPKQDTAWRLRDGSWRGPPPAALPPQAAAQVTGSVKVGLWSEAQPTLAPERPGAALLIRPAQADWSALRWSTVQAATHTVQILPVVEAVDSSFLLPESRVPIPDGYATCTWYDPRQAAAQFIAFADNVSDIWPEMPAAHDLATAGLYTESGRIVYDAIQEWQEAKQRGGGDARQQRMVSLKISALDWRPFVLHTRDHYDAVRTCSGVWKGSADEQVRLAGMKLSWPIVKGDELWANARQYGVDPFLMLGLMRQESTYQNAALSPVGAIGLIQVMPGTGAKLAAMLGEPRYSPRQLEDPVTNLRYGIFYFGKLLERFDGVFPFAVASYNGGPHNMSRWYRSSMGKIETDQMVEMIEYDETRDYVKRVTGNYARYVEIYEPGARVLLPPRPLGDDPSVVDF